MVMKNPANTFLRVRFKRFKLNLFELFCSDKLLE